MLKIIMCDDDERDLAQIAGLVEQYRSHHADRPLAVDQTQSVARLLERLRQGERFDIYILDIMMEEQDGISVGREIRRHCPKSAIIYVTGSPEYALRAFGVYASGYLLKPVKTEEFSECMGRVIAQMESREERIYTFKSKEGIVNVELSRLLRVENVSRVMHFYMDDGSVFESVYIRKPFEKQLEQVLADERFIQPHKSFIINMEQVEKVLAHDFMMADGMIVPISRNNLTTVKRQYLEYLSRSEWK